MAKSTIKLSDGTIVTVEGSMEEVAKLLSLYGNAQAKVEKKAPTGSSGSGGKSSKTDSGEGKVNVVDLVNTTKGADDFAQIEQKILDVASQVDRVLLPLFIAGRELKGNFVLTSNDIYIFLKEFGISMALPNISKTLSTTATKYVLPSSTRKTGVATSYKISRPGRQHIEQVLTK